MSLQPPLPKRRPTVLVTDARDQRNRPQILRRPTIRHISIDNILQQSSEIPSGQSRTPPPRPRGDSNTPLPTTRRPSGAPRPVKKQKVVNQTNLPLRSSKVTEKLVLLPDSQKPRPDWDYDEDNSQAPLRDDEATERSHSRGPDGTPRKSYAERLPKNRRAEKLARVTAFCTASSWRLMAIAKFMKEHHQARTKLYDECLYCAYHLPLLPGSGGYRVKSSPILKNPGGRAVLDMQIERNEQRDYHEEYFRGRTGRRRVSDDIGMIDPDRQISALSDSPPIGDSLLSPKSNEFDERRGSNGHSRNTLSPEPPDAPEASSFAELYIYSYGVAVFWNFTERQEKDILADLAFAKAPQKTLFAIQPLQVDEYETEQFHFEYSPRTTRPRIFNDMITLRSGNHMIKLAMSHAIAQSTKLSRFEERMALTMKEVEDVPKSLALNGTLGMKREDVLKMSGKLFKLRVDVNLSSNTLDTPEFFWDSEPGLHPLYAAVREYLEIKQRVLILNERCQVFLDLASILADSIADSNMSRITWIIIILIIVSIMVTLGEVTLRFSILKREHP
ncbi:hypothetical protein H072_3495 [Dactylellina haptotyla CBS 200.50]|uniref:DUF155 domain-containing protein n=1 Tax=Dactylellina haptotyla (strain CBS 200.50) TaxID=1284197 RepID=S8AN20_DACHA|nr:hypothetical protein H072_3495 [Dactylellina haptotyla CBS 200.50]